MIDLPWITTRCVSLGEYHASPSPGFVLCKMRAAGLLGKLKVLISQGLAPICSGHFHQPHLSRGVNTRILRWGGGCGTRTALLSKEETEKLVVRV